jgi:hypothetical protein
LPPALDRDFIADLEVASSGSRIRTCNNDH